MGLFSCFARPKALEPPELAAEPVQAPTPPEQLAPPAAAAPPPLPARAASQKQTAASGRATDTDVPARAGKDQTPRKGQSPLSKEYDTAQAAVRPDADQASAADDSDVGGHPSCAPVEADQGVAGRVGDGDIRRVFDMWCAFGTRQAVAEMDSAHFAKLFRDCDLVGPQLSLTDIDLAFTRAKPKGGRKLPFDAFLAALAECAQRSGSTLEALVGVLSASEGPVARATRADAVRLHDDKSTYTGVYAKGGPKVDGRAPDMAALLDRSEPPAAARRAPSRASRGGSITIVPPPPAPPLPPPGPAQAAAFSVRMRASTMGGAAGGKGAPPRRATTGGSGAGAATTSGEALVDVEAAEAAGGGVRPSGGPRSNTALRA